MTRRLQLMTNRDIHSPRQNVPVKKKTGQRGGRTARAALKTRRFAYAVKCFEDYRDYRYCYDISATLIPTRRGVVRVRVCRVCAHTCVRLYIRTVEVVQGIVGNVRSDQILRAIRKCQRALRLGNAEGVRAVRESARHENEGGRDHANKHRANVRRYRQCVLSEKTVLSDCRSHNQIQSEHDRELSLSVAYSSISRVTNVCPLLPSHMYCFVLR